MFKQANANTSPTHCLLIVQARYNTGAATLEVERNKMTDLHFPITFAQAFGFLKTVLRVAIALAFITGPLLALPSITANETIMKQNGGGAVLIVSLKRGRT